MKKIIQEHQRLYWDESEFQKLYKQYKKDKNNQNIKSEITKMLYSLVDNLIKGTGLKFFYKHTSLSREDLLQEGVLKCLMELDKYKPKKARAFSFFSVVAKRHLILYINKNLYCSDINENNLKEYYQLLQESTEEEIMLLINQFYDVINNYLKNIKLPLTQYQYARYTKAKNYLEFIINRGYYTQSDLLYIKNKILPVINEIEK